MSGFTDTLIHDSAERARRQQTKQDKVLRWLRLNTWSTAAILMDVVGLGTRQAIHTTLTSMARQGLVRQAEIRRDFGPSVFIWGITPHGVAIAAAEGESIQAKTLEPSKVNPATLMHSIDVQRLQLTAEQAGWHWKPANGEFSRSEAKYADAIGLRPDAERVAIEVERTIKTVKRYAEILVSHLEARKQRKWEWIYYLSPDAVIRDRVRRAFQEISHARWRGQVIKITDAHRAPFKFYCYNEEWT